MFMYNYIKNVPKVYFSNSPTSNQLSFLESASNSHLSSPETFKMAPTDENRLHTCTWSSEGTSATSQPSTSSNTFSELLNYRNYDHRNQVIIKS